jgi:PhoPQ-activated pathogenicity-related protein
MGVAAAAWAAIGVGGWFACPVLGQEMLEATVVETGAANGPAHVEAFDDATRWIGAMPLGDGKPAEVGAGLSALERYVAFDDGAFAWSKAAETRVPGATVHVLRLTSQRWRPDGQTSHPLWTHYLTVGVPDEVRSRTPVFIIGGGRRRDEPPPAPPMELVALLGAGAVVVYLDNVPNQPLELEGDGKRRFEDDLLARTWVLAARDNDASWIGRFPMVKSAVKGMDAVEAFLKTLTGPDGGPRRDVTPDGFFVVGASKRGWTTWLTAAVDARVVGLAPMVIDMLNMPAHTPHHFASYGFWAPALRDYEANGIPAMFGTEALNRVIAHEDPMHYIARVGERPVYVVNAGGDEFFPTDSLRHYEGLLPANARVRVVPNAGHSLRNAGMTTPLEILAFYRHVRAGKALPGVRWSVEPGEGNAVVRVTLTAPAERATLWQVDNPKARDFRMDQTGPNWAPTEVRPVDDAGLVYEVRLQNPEAGWRASLVEFRFAGEGGAAGGGVPLTLTTRVFITPDTLPHAAAVRGAIPAAQ